MSSYPTKFSASMTVIIASILKSPSVSRSSSRNWNARVAGNAEPEHSMRIRSGRRVSATGCLRSTSQLYPNRPHPESLTMPISSARQARSTWASVSTPELRGGSPLTCIRLKSRSRRTDCFVLQAGYPLNGGMPPRKCLLQPGGVWCFGLPWTSPNSFLSKTTL